MCTKKLISTICDVFFLMSWVNKIPAAQKNKKKYAKTTKNYKRKEQQAKRNVELLTKINMPSFQIRRLHIHIYLYTLCTYMGQIS